MKARLLAVLVILLAAGASWARADERADAVMTEITALRAEQAQNIEKLQISLSARAKAEDELAKLTPDWHALEAKAQQLDSDGSAAVSRWSCTQTGQGTYTCPCGNDSACLADVDHVNALVSQVKSGLSNLQSRTDKAVDDRKQANATYQALTARQHEIARRLAVLEVVKRAIASGEQREACALQCRSHASGEAAAQCLLRCTAGARGPSGMSTVEETLPRVGDARPFGTGGRPSATEEAIREFTSKPRPGPRSFKMKEPPPPVSPHIEEKQQ